MAKPGHWRVRAERLLFESRWFRLRQEDVVLPGGADITYTHVDHPGYAMIVPLLGDGRVVMERVYRHPIRRTLLECPSGGLDGEPPDQAARRELEEETGYLAGRLTPLGSFYGSSGMSNERFHLFLATDLDPGGRIQREITEEIEVVKVPLPELRSGIRSGAVADGPSALAILLATQTLEAEGT